MRKSGPTLDRKSRDEWLIDVSASLLELTIFCIGSYYISSFLYKKALARRSGDNDARARLEKILLQREEDDCDDDDDDEINVEGKQSRKKTWRRSLPKLSLNEYEAIIAQDVINPQDMSTAFRDIGGIDSIKAELWDLVVLPLLRPDLFSSPSSLVSPPRGILLYGAPGTGKTMIAKAIAKESGATFVNVRLSSIMNKWFGESNKLIAATFSLAAKLSPSVIFIDEIDAFLSQRDSSEGSAMGSMKSEFLTLWDGILTDSRAPITVLGATNRPYDLDTAILRRLPRTFEIGLPDCPCRIQILRLFLEKQDMTCKARDMIPFIGKVTEGYSGSDLKELCRAAAMEPLRELSKESSRLAVMSSTHNTKETLVDNVTRSVGKQTFGDGNNDGRKENLTVDQRNKLTLVQANRAIRSRGKKKNVGPPIGTKIRPVDEKDFMVALQKVKRTGESARNFLNTEINSTTDNKNGLLQSLLSLQQTLLSSSRQPHESPSKSRPSSSDNGTTGESKENTDEEDDVPCIEGDVNESPFT